MATLWWRGAPARQLMRAAFTVSGYGQTLCVTRERTTICASCLISRLGNQTGTAPKRSVTRPPRVSTWARSSRTVSSGVASASTSRASLRLSLSTFGPGCAGTPSTLWTPAKMPSFYYERHGKPTVQVKNEASFSDMESFLAAVNALMELVARYREAYRRRWVRKNWQRINDEWIEPLIGRDILAEGY